MEKDLLEGFARYLEQRSKLVHELPGQTYPSITISRETGAGGIEIAQLLVESLAQSSKEEWTIFNKHLAELVWKNRNLPDRVRRFVHSEVPQSIQNTVQELLGVGTQGSQMVELTAATVLRLTLLGNAIFLGRGSNIIAACQKAVFHVRLVAPFANRVRQIEEHYRTSPQEAVEMISASDEARRRYVKHYFRAEIDDPINYHLVINTGLTGYEEAARIIADATIKFHSRG